MNPQTDALRTQARPTFASIVCGVDGSRPSFEAARQAALLTDDGANVAYVAMSWEQGTGASAVATLSHEHARDALRRGGVDRPAADQDLGALPDELQQLAAGVGDVGQKPRPGVYEVYLESAVSQGSTFSFSLPRRRPAGA